jgi:hypothetical protein
MMNEAVLAVHVVVILFNVFGLVAVPIGAICKWRFVHIRWWRVLHVLSLAVVAAQALAGRACFLTAWQDELTATAQSATPLIVRWVNQMVYWPYRSGCSRRSTCSSLPMRWRCSGWFQRAAWDRR